MIALCCFTYQKLQTAEKFSISSGVLITNIHASVIERSCIEAKSCKLMPTSLVFNKN
jgi:hypothetical protein